MRKAFLNGEWIDRNERIEVRSPFDGKTIESVPKCGAADVTKAIDGAVAGAEAMRQLTARERYEILSKAAALLRERSERLARQLSSEEGKTIAEARTELARSHETLVLSAEEAKRITGETLPLDAAPGGANKLCFTLRVPCGIVAAITPFNFPMNLVCHKVGPALAAGNAVVLKPATNTPLSALSLVEILLESGLPPLGIACITGPGAEIGGALAEDARVRKLSFTGSRDVGETLCRAAGLKRVTMELGSNSPMIVMRDADLEQVALAAVATGFSNAGQTCISTQRILTERKAYAPLLDLLKEKVSAIRAGDPLSEETQMGPLVREADAKRVEEWIGEAVKGGARKVTGGERKGAMISPTVLADVRPEMRVSRDELFGPAVAVTPVDGVEEAIRLANDTRYGLSASIFTRDLGSAMKFAREVESGSLHINWGPGWRADLMPYGGLKESGFGKEGPKYAIESMTEVKTVIIHNA